MPWPVGIGCDKGETNLLFHCAGQSDFGLLRFLFNALQGIWLIAQVHAVRLFEFIKNPIHDAPIPIVAAQMRISVGRLDFKHPIAVLEDGNIEGTASQGREVPPQHRLPMKAIPNRPVSGSCEAQLGTKRLVALLSAHSLTWQ
jgi:hypothetical protein